MLSVFLFSFMLFVITHVHFTAWLASVACCNSISHETLACFRRCCRSSHVTGGSLVRPRKLSAPVQCARAVADRYGVILDTESTVDRQELDALQQDINARFVQVRGDQPRSEEGPNPGQGRGQRPEEVGLSGKGGAGPAWRRRAQVRGWDQLRSEAGQKWTSHLDSLCSELLHIIVFS